MTSRAEMAHLLRRLTFGPRPAEIDAALRDGRDATLARLLTPAADPAAPPMPALAPEPLGNQAGYREQVQAVTLWWLDRMVAAGDQFAEKLVFFWHGHWATSVQKVRRPALMLAQQQTFRDLGHGDFLVLARAMLRDPALLIWLDGQQNTAAAPNENLARELMELFTLGVGNYTETDVREAARALTGWQVQRATGRAVLNPRRHDAGTKTILGQTGNVDADGLAGILVSQPAHPRFLAARMWYRFAATDPVPADTATRLAGAYQPGRDVTALVRALCTDPAFAGTSGSLVKQPVEWAVGALRQLGIRPARLPDAQQRQLLSGVAALGQRLFAPTNVGGWPGGAAWLTTSAALYRLRVAALLAAHADPGAVHDITAAATTDRLDALAHVLAVDAFTDRTVAVLRPATGSPARLLALGLASPEYVVS